MTVQLLRFQAVALGAAFLLFGYVARTEAQTTIARQDFDGNEINFVSGFDPVLDNLDGGGGDYFGVVNIAGWPQGFPPGVPFSLVDDSFESVSDPLNAPFPSDLEGIFGSGSDYLNHFFAISDTREWTGVAGKNPLTASWTFDISSAGSNAMKLRMDLGQQSDGDSFGGITSASFLVEYSIDGGPFVTALSCAPADATGSGFSYRAMDSGAVPTAASVLQATSPSGTLKKFSGQTGLEVVDTFLDKTPNKDTANTGTLDTYIVDLDGNGNSIQIRMTCFVDFEAMAFDNIEIFTESAGFLPGDANGDGNVDFGDIDPFLLALFDPAAYALMYPDIDPNVVLDFDGDNNLSFGDIDGFIAAIFGG